MRIFTFLRWTAIVLVCCGLLAGWMVFSRHRRKHPRTFPVGIVIHHTATPSTVRGRPVDAALIDGIHARRGFAVTDRDGHVYHIGYHFLVLQDGTVQRGRPEYLYGAHAKGHPDMLGIALVGDYERASNHGQYGRTAPPSRQLAAVAALTRTLMAKYELTVHEVYLHRDLVHTACPGNNFPRAAFFAAIARRD